MTDREDTHPAEQSELPDYLQELERIIDISIGDPFLFGQALRHRSVLYEDEDLEDVDSYERLEFLGDAVLDLIVSRYLYERFPDETEGYLTKLRSRLVRGDSLARFAGKLNLGDLILMGDRARYQDIQASKSVLADVFEALIGALYLDQGFDLTYKFVLEIIERFVDFDQLAQTIENYKSMLLEYAQSKGWEYPVYNLIKEEGPGHDRTFTVEVMVHDAVRGTGVGKSKKKAEQAAAESALESFGVLD
ncbi:MAG: ribonuclease III [Bacteroidota bacterium]